MEQAIAAHTHFGVEMPGFFRQSLNINGVETVVYSAGRGKPVVFLHGAGTFPGFAALEALRQSHRLIIPYHPGFGETADAPYGWTIQDYVSHYSLLFDRLGLETFDLVGFSLGGWLAVMIASALGSRVSRLVLAAPAGLAVAEAPVPDVSAIPGQEMPAWLSHDPAVAGSYFPHGPDERFGISIMRELGAYGRLLGDQPQGDLALPAHVQNLAISVLILWGEQDRLRPYGQAQAWQALLPAAKLETLPQTGHLLFEEYPGAATLAAAFLSSP